MCDIILYKKNKQEYTKVCANLVILYLFQKHTEGEVTKEQFQWGGGGNQCNGQNTDGSKVFLSRADLRAESAIFIGNINSQNSLTSYNTVGLNIIYILHFPDAIPAKS